MLQLRQLDLQFTFIGTSALGKNIKNQSGSIQHPALQLFFQVTFLGGRKSVIKQHHFGFMRDDGLANLFNFARTDEIFWITLMAPGYQQLNRFCTGGNNKLFKFTAVFLFRLIHHFQMNQNCAFAAIGSFKKQ